MNWNHIILEGYCTRKYSIKGDKYVYKITDSKELKTEKIINKEYDSNYRTPKKPRYCEDRICQVCFFKNCPHLGVGEVPEKDYKKIMKCIGKMYDGNS